ncbi:MAG: saccharopine dehydrogenase NADP-binding domain-containing protein [Bacteroidia bacterium]|nr:saccharopine dehydrogenase NADP-binding domain-containing protein [Bacteroidia bacterium]
MNTILVLGAGLSSTYLINYLIAHAATYNWEITVADGNLETAKLKTNNNPLTKAVCINANDEQAVSDLIKQHDVVISMLPAFMHVPIAKNCITHKKHLITASYISNEMQELHTQAIEAGVLLLNECGLDPGIDHLSAIKLIHEIKDKGGMITSFKSFCGGLVSPKYDDNPWNYKFTWNPRNVVVAGQSTAKYLSQGEIKFIPPSRIFTETENIEIENHGAYESYANRDSLGYINVYGIENAQTVLRGTLRKKGFSKAWNNLVKLGLTDDSFVIPNSDEMTYRELLNAFTPGDNINNLEQRVASFLNITTTNQEFEKLKWLGLFENQKITCKAGSPAAILQALLQQKWKLKEGELDRIVMYHELEFKLNNKQKKVTSSLVVDGETQVLTAMAKTVGLPLAIATKLIMLKKIQLKGVHLPILPELYLPILEELKTYGIRFEEKEFSLE